MSKIILRDYQKEAVDIGIDYFESKGIKKPSVLVAPVAAGKSILIGNIASKLTHPTLVLQPSKELLEQNYGKFTLFGGVASIYSASVGVKEIGDITYATLGSIKKLASEFKKQGVKNVIIDESHYGYSPEPGSMFMKFINVLKPDRVLGFTATPIRLKQYGTMTDNWSQLNMLNRMKPSYFKNILHVVPISLMVGGKFWCDLAYEQYDFDESKLTLNSTKAEFTEHTIKQAIADQGINNTIYKRIKLALQEGRKNILVFNDCVATVEKMAELFKDVGGCVHAGTKMKDRNKLVKEFKHGDIKVIFNMGIFTTGFDHPELDCVIIGRPTNSLALYYQICGRGTRLSLTGQKKDCLIIDFCNNVKRFGRLETLRFENLDGYGWGLFNEKNLLTGIPMGTDVTIEDIMKKINTKKENLVDYTMPFGKHKGLKLSEIPLSYRNWLLVNISEMDFKGTTIAAVKEQLLFLLDQEAEVPMDDTKLVLVDFNNITHGLYKRRSLNTNGLKAYKQQLRQQFNTSNVVVISDANKDTYWRKEVFPEYKANRKKADLDEAFKEGLNDIYANSDITVVDGLEADDIIADEVRDSPAKEVYVISADGDFKQLAIFSKFKQVNSGTLKEMKTSKKEGIGVLVTKILKGDRKDNVPKSHTQGRILTKDLDIVIDKIYSDILSYVKQHNIKDIKEVNLQDIFWIHLNNKFNMVEEQYKLNFKLLNLIQKQN